MRTVGRKMIAGAESADRLTLGRAFGSMRAPATFCFL
jgi:hypothetical protein